MRTSSLVTGVLLLAVAAGSAESIATSPECERWIADYHHKLAESHPVQEMAHGSKKVKAYVHRVIGERTAKPHVVRTASTHDPLRPQLTPQQMVKRFQVLCGDLPPVETALLTPPAPPAPTATPLLVPGTPVAPPPGLSTPVPNTPGIPLIPGGPSGPGTPTNPNGPGTPTNPGSPSGPPSPPPGPPGPPTPPPGPPGPPTPPPTPPPPGPPAPPVPEPSSLVLMLSGSLLAGGYTLRRKLTRI